ncbi:SLAP domain-containing protein [Lactobacillus crispatus]|uniref:YSIRK-type signal peptide-containing protein n=1 Tax=Lactobacillus crispatus TaxID=47770 RepID=A0AB37DDU4_9LACO|nr:SLAP domain-containing protein [Lactobacillus crispatus]OCX10222.1 hypothetical protein BEV10_03445 [Lactobacillus crispatus]QHQ67368.1 YSIRK-type signal peptide-containing protein [Lactobacillus crispatus]
MSNKNRQEIQNRFSLRKLTIGLASVSLGMFFMQTSNQVKADTLSTTPATNRANVTTVQTVQPGQPGQPVQPVQPGQPGQNGQNGQTDQTTPTPTSTSRDNSTGHSSQNLVTRPTTLALFKQITPAPSTPAPSTTVPSYDGTKVVSTPFYNNPGGTNSNLIDNQSKTGQYTFYFTAKDASGKEYASSYAAEKGNPTGVVLNSILDKDAGAYDPNSLEFHFYYQNNTDQDQTINYTLRMADYLNPYKAGRPESSLVPDGSRISDVKVTSKQGNTYDISSVTKTLDGVKSRDGDLRYVGDVPVNLTVKANDAINLVIPFVLNTTAKKSNTTIDDHNEFSVRENGQQTGYLVVRSSTYAPLFSEHKIYPLVNVGNNNYTHDYPDNPGAFDLDPSVYLDNDFMDGFWDGRTGVYKASKPTNLNTVYNSYTYTFLLLDNYQKSLTKHGFTVAFSDGKPVPYYMYQLSKTGSKVVDKNGNPVQGETKGHPYFEVVPVILLNQDETYTTKTAPTAWDPSTMVNKVADPTNYRYWDQKTDSAVRKDNTAAQLTANDFTVTITKDGKVVKPDDNGKYDLSKPGTYTVTYSKDFNGTTISNSGQITVTPVKEPDKPSGNNNNNSNHNNNGNNDNKGGNNLDAIVPVNPSDNNSNTAPTDNDSKPTDETGEQANICSCQDTITKTLMHAAYLYDNQGVRIKKPFIKAYTAVVVAKTPVVINGIKYYKVPCKDEYIKSGNFDGTSRVLRHNAFVYNHKGKAVRIKGIKRLLKKWRLVRTYGAPFNINGHQMYRIAKNRYIKVKNFK